MARSRSKLPPITGTAIAAIKQQSDVATMMSMSAAPRVPPKRRLRKGGRASVTGRLFGLGRNHDERLELQKALLANALHVHQVFDPLEAAALGPVFDDPLRDLAADAGQRLELLDRGGVEIEERFRGRLSRRALRLQGYGQRRETDQSRDAERGYGSKQCSHGILR